nr:hypothetical protein [Nonlabens ulvanivorans]
MINSTPIKVMMIEQIRTTYRYASLRSSKLETSISFTNSIEKIRIPNHPKANETKPRPPSSSPKAIPCRCCPPPNSGRFNHCCPEEENSRKTPVTIKNA